MLIECMYLRVIKRLVFAGRPGLGLTNSLGTEPRVKTIEWALNHGSKQIFIQSKGFRPWRHYPLAIAERFVDMGRKVRGTMSSWNISFTAWISTMYPDTRHESPSMTQERAISPLHRKGVPGYIVRHPIPYIFCNQKLKQSSKER